ncbi:MAG: hypothetical protein JXQ71_17830 [Verrucomicrobia bacterium]|nr:hypothetical protein [Verrucomicrobiota bacterium]
MSSTTVDLGGWTIAGASFTFPPGAALAPGGLVLLLKTNATSAAAFRKACQRSTASQINST